MVSPGKPIISRIEEILVRIAVIAASPDLQLRPIVRVSVRNIETLGISKDLNVSTIESPFLSISGREDAVLNGHCSTIRVRGSSQAFVAVVSRLEKDGGEISGVIV